MRIVMSSANVLKRHQNLKGYHHGLGERRGRKSARYDGHVYRPKCIKHTNRENAIDFAKNNTIIRRRKPSCELCKAPAPHWLFLPGPYRWPAMLQTIVAFRNPECEALR